MPEMWMQVEFISNKNNDIAEQFNLTKERVSYSQLFDERGNYKLLQAIENIHRKEVQDRNKLENDLLKLDEQINIMFLLVNHQIPAMFPDANDPNHKWYASGDDLTGFEREDSLFISRSYKFYISEVEESMQSGDWDQPEIILNTISEYQNKNDAVKLINAKKIDSEIKYNKRNVFSNVRNAYFILGVLLLV